MPRMGSCPWRRGGVQHLHQDVSLRAGPVRLRCGARHSAGDRPLSQLVLLQYLRDFVVVALHPGAAGHHLREKAVQEDSARAGHRRALRRRPRERHPPPAHGPQERWFSWRNFFLVLDRIMHWAEAVHIRPLRKLALEARRKVDAGAPGNDRRPGRDLSGHAERHPGAALPGLLRRRSAGDSRPRRV